MAWSGHSAQRCVRISSSVHNSELPEVITPLDSEPLGPIESREKNTKLKSVNTSDEEGVSGVADKLLRFKIRAIMNVPFGL